MTCSISFAPIIRASMQFSDLGGGGYLMGFGFVGVKKIFASDDLDPQSCCFKTFHVGVVYLVGKIYRVVCLVGKFAAFLEIGGPGGVWLDVARGHDAIRLGVAFFGEEFFQAFFPYLRGERVALIFRAGLGDLLCRADTKHDLVVLAEYLIYQEFMARVLRLESSQEYPDLSLSCHDHDDAIIV